MTKTNQKMRGGFYQFAPNLYSTSIQLAKMIQDGVLVLPFSLLDMQKALEEIFGPDHPIYFKPRSPGYKDIIKDAFYVITPLPKIPVGKQTPVYNVGWLLGFRAKPPYVGKFYGEPAPYLIDWRAGGPGFEDGNYSHPRSQGHMTTICSDMQVLGRELIEQGKWTEAILDAIGAALNVHPADMTIPPVCDHCSHLANTECNTCIGALCEQHSGECALCKWHMCPKHQDTIKHKGKEVRICLHCAKVATTCHLCGELAKSSSYCQECLKPMCDACFTYCNVCGRDICLECSVICAKPGNAHARACPTDLPRAKHDAILDDIRDRHFPSPYGGRRCDQPYCEARFLYPSEAALPPPLNKRAFDDEETSCRECIRFFKENGHWRGEEEYEEKEKKLHELMEEWQKNLTRRNERDRAREREANHPYEKK